MHELPSQPVTEETIAPGHETDEVRLRGFLIFLAWFAASGVVIFALMWFTMVGFEAMGKKGDEKPSPLAANQVIPPEPRLQPSPAQGSTTDVEDMRRLREREDRVLNTYAIETENGGRARVPIDRAMQLLVERGGSATRPSTAPSTQPAPKRIVTPEATGGVR